MPPEQSKNESIDERTQEAKSVSKGSAGKELNLMGMAGAGLEFGGVIALLAMGGWWLDKKWNTGPWLTVAGATVGVVGGIYNLWRIGSRVFKS